jgi:hypothetical protein
MWAAHQMKHMGMTRKMQTRTTTVVTGKGEVTFTMRAPQSWQSVPSSHKVLVEPTPPSSQLPSPASWERLARREPSEQALEQTRGAAKGDGKDGGGGSHGGDPGGGPVGVDMANAQSAVSALPHRALEADPNRWGAADWRPPSAAAPPT